LFGNARCKIVGSDGEAVEGIKVEIKKFPMGFSLACIPNQ
jgi:hypothetical protein